MDSPPTPPCAPDTTAAANPPVAIHPPLGGSRAAFRYQAAHAGARPTARRPGPAFLLAHPAHAVALGFGAGLSPLAPGTAGTLWAWLAFLVLQPLLSPLATGLVLAGATLLGWWACTRTATALQLADPGCIVWDEVVAFWLVLWLVLPAGPSTQLAAFVLFRFFDAAKPGPVGWADKAFKGSGWRGGLGILLDDLVAAFCTLLVLAIWKAW